MGSWLGVLSVPPEGLLHGDAILACLIRGCLPDALGDGFTDGVGQVGLWLLVVGVLVAVEPLLGGHGPNGQLRRI